MIPETIFEIIIACLIFFSATAYQIGCNFSDTQGVVYKIGIVLLYIISLSMEPRRHIINPIVNIIPLLMLITFLLVPATIRPMIIDSVICVFMGIMLFYLVSNYSDFRYILPAVYGVIILTSVMVFIQYMGHDPICLNGGGHHNTDMVGFFGFKYVFGAWMAIATPILLLKKKWIGILSGVLCICSLSWACIGLMFSAIVFGTFFINKKLCIAAFIILGLLAIPIYCLVLHKPNNYILTIKYKVHSRIDVESKFLVTLMTKPYTGWGVGTFKLIGPGIVNSKTGNWGTMTDAWNDYLERGVEMGLGAIALMLWLFINSFKRFFRSRLGIPVFASLAIVPFGIMFHNYFNHFSLSVLIITLFAWWENQNIIKELDYGRTS